MKNRRCRDDNPIFFEPKIQVDSNKNPPDMQNTQEDYINIIL